MLKSAELTGSWEKRLKEIEKGEFNAGTFIKNMKKMVDDLVYEVRSEKVKANISHTTTQKVSVLKKSNVSKGINAERCPNCKQGYILKGSSAYGCSAYKNGCDFKLPFEFSAKKISEKQFMRLLQKGSTVNLKGFKTKEGTVEGLLRFDDHFKLVLEPKNKKILASTGSTKESSDTLICPKCRKGTVIKGKLAFGCDEYKEGCNFKVTFEQVKQLAQGKSLTKELVYSILKK